MELTYDSWSRLRERSHSDIFTYNSTLLFCLLCSIVATIVPQIKFSRPQANF